MGKAVCCISHRELHLGCKANSSSPAGFWFCPSAVMSVLAAFAREGSVCDRLRRSGRCELQVFSLASSRLER